MWSPKKATFCWWSFELVSGFENKVQACVGHGTQAGWAQGFLLRRVSFFFFLIAKLYWFIWETEKSFDEQMWGLNRAQQRYLVSVACSLEDAGWKHMEMHSLMLLLHDAACRLKPKLMNLQGHFCVVCTSLQHDSSVQSHLASLLPKVTHWSSLKEQTHKPHL